MHSVVFGSIGEATYVFSLTGVKTFSGKQDRCLLCDFIAMTANIVM